MSFGIFGDAMTFLSVLKLQQARSMTYWESKQMMPQAEGAKG